MCGLSGAASSFLSTTEVDVFEELMLVSNLRGKLGAGAIIVTNRGTTVQNFKTIGNGIDLCQSGSYLKATVGKAPQVLVGHTRLPTRGGNSIENVHPHKAKDISGVHNGTIRKIGGKDVPIGASDSALLFQQISEKGAREAFASVDGAYAVVWIDYHLRTLNFIRNSQRPLWFAKCHWKGSGRTLYWSSEKEFLQLILGRRKIQCELVELPINERWSLPVNMDCDGFTVDKNFVPFGRREGKEVESYDHWYDSVPFHETQSSIADSLIGPGSRMKNTTPTHVLNNPSPTSSDRGVKQTYVINKDGIMVRKGHEEKQVTLPGTDRSISNESEGSASNENVVSEDCTSIDVVEERKESSPTPRDNRGRFLAVNKDNLSPEEKAFESEMEQAAAWRAQVDKEFYDLIERISDPAPDPEALFDKAYEKPKKEESAFLETEPGHYLATTEVHKICENGCAYCGDSVDYSKKLAWVNQREFLCEPCQTNKTALSCMYDFYPFAPIMEQWKEGKLEGMGLPPFINESHTFSSTDKRNYN